MQGTPRENVARSIDSETFATHANLCTIPGYSQQIRQISSERRNEKEIHGRLYGNDVGRGHVG